MEVIILLVYDWVFKLNILRAIPLLSKDYASYFLVTAFLPFYVSKFIVPLNIMHFSQIPQKLEGRNQLFSS